mgnify:CR=1 FL=1
MEAESPRKGRRCPGAAPDGPDKLPRLRVCINLSDCKYAVHGEVCRQLGWEVFRNDESNLNCDVIWNDAAVNQDILGSLKCHQKLNHFSGIFAVARKNFLAQHLKKMQRRFPDEYDFFPATFCLPAERVQLREFAESGRGGPFHIVKPEASSQGKGIYLLRRGEEPPGGEPCVVQRYVDRPLLIDGLKFDLRIYVLMTSVTPLTLYVYEEGLGRFATEPYTAPSPKNMGVACQHLTNYAVNKASPRFSFDQQGHAGHKRSLAAVWAALEAQGVDPRAVTAEIDRMVIKTMCAIQPMLSHVYCSSQPEDVTGAMCFEILGVDVLIEEGGRPYLLEVNHSPSFNTDTPFDRRVKSQLLADVFALLDLSVARRNRIVAHQRQRLQERLTLRQAKLPANPHREEERQAYRRELIELGEAKKTGFRLIYAGEDPSDRYGQFMEYAHLAHLKQTGVLAKPGAARPAPEPRVATLNSLKENRRRQNVPPSLTHVSGADFSPKRKAEHARTRIQHSLSRLFPREQQPPSRKQPQRSLLPVIKPSIVTFDFQALQAEATFRKLPSIF